MGLPIIATDIRGCREVVDHGTNGLLVPVREPSALVEALHDLIDDRDRRRAMGGASRDLAVARFDDRRQVAVTLETYSRLEGSRSADRS